MTNDVICSESSAYNVFFSVISGLEFEVWGYKTSITIGKYRSAFSAKAIFLISSGFCPQETINNRQINKPAASAYVFTLFIYWTLSIMVVAVGAAVVALAIAGLHVRRNGDGAATGVV